MVRAVTVVELYGQNNAGDIRRYACASGAAITKGDILTILDPRLASYSITAGDVFGGIASMDKEATDNSTSISTWQNGIFEASASGNITVGQYVKLAGHNYVMACLDSDVTCSYAKIAGVALETASDNEVINIRIIN